jgi:hypothetical protein
LLHENAGAFKIKRNAAIFASRQVKISLQFPNEINSDFFGSRYRSARHENAMLQVATIKKPIVSFVFSGEFHACKAPSYSA